MDEGLAENIFRDSCDPGAVGVIAAGGKLPFSRSANEMLGKFGVRLRSPSNNPIGNSESNHERVVLYFIRGLSIIWEPGVLDLRYEG